MKDDNLFFFCGVLASFNRYRYSRHELAMHNLKTETHPSSYKCVLLKCSPQKSDNMISQEFCIQNQELILKFE